MVLIRPFESRDQTCMQDIERLCPQGDDKCAMGVFKPHGVASRYDLYDNFQIMVAEKDDNVVGWIGWTQKQDQEKTYIYLAEVNVHPNYQGHGIATQLVDEMEKETKSYSPHHIYCYIYEPNKASKALFSSLGYHELFDVHSAALSTYKKLEVSDKYQIKPLGPNDMVETVNLINNYYAGYKHFQPYTEESFQSYLERLGVFGEKSFYLVKQNNNTVACGGIWDCSNYADFCFAREPISWKIMKGVYDLLQHFRKLPYLPAEGEYFKMYMLFDHAFHPDDADAIKALIAHINNQLIIQKKGYLLATLNPSDPLIAELKQFKPMVEKWSLYAKSLQDLFQTEQFYIDVRDLIP